MAAWLGCTVEELGERMSAEEMGLWIAYLDMQPFGSRHVEQAVALILSAVKNGPSVRKDKRPWSPLDFMVRDAFAPPPAPAAPGKNKRGPSLAALKAHFKRGR